jgi:hypothetical protein
MDVSVMWEGFRAGFGFGMISGVGACVAIYAAWRIWQDRQP